MTIDDASLMGPWESPGSHYYEYIRSTNWPSRVPLGVLFLLVMDGELWHNI